jgi:hypothetical protein
MQGAVVVIVVAAGVRATVGGKGAVVWPLFSDRGVAGHAEIRRCRHTAACTRFRPVFAVTRQTRACVDVGQIGGSAWIIEERHRMGVGSLAQGRLVATQTRVLRDAAKWFVAAFAALFDLMVAVGGFSRQQQAIVGALMPETEKCEGRDEQKAAQKSPCEPPLLHVQKYTSEVINREDVQPQQRDGGPKQQLVQ